MSTFEMYKFISLNLKQFDFAMTELLERGPTRGVKFKESWILLKKTQFKYKPVKEK